MFSLPLNPSETYITPLMGEDTVGLFLLTGLSRELDYRVPEHLAGKVVPGSLVRVPLQNRTVLGVVWRQPGISPLPANRLKLVTALVQPCPVLSAPLRELAEWIRNYYASPMEAVLETMIPKPVRQELKMKKEKYLRLNPAKPLSPEDLATMQRKAPKQHQLYLFIREQLLSPRQTVVTQRLGIASSVISRMVELGLILAEERIVDREVYQDEEDLGEVVREGHVLNDEQTAALEGLDAARAKNDFSVQVLHGVTGSGKTEVYLQLIRRVMEAGGGVIYLVPELALTPQTVGRLRARMEQECGVKTMVWHSSLSDGERLDAWRQLVTGEARIVVGARSAIFAPVAKLGLIIVDEEHEGAYKQGETPRYQGRDVAVYRGMLEKSLVVLGSATPSLETHWNIQRGRYQVHRLSKRIDDRKLPYIDIIDMRREILSKNGNFGLSRPLAEKLRDRFERREQSILFINRRGFSSAILCPDCGHVCGCPHCSVPLTYHKTDETMKCHLCGYLATVPETCPSCLSLKIRQRGFGTQRVEEAVRRILPKARVFRMDSDSMAKKHLFREILGDFRSGKIDVLVGTQMIAKGLDFPNVTLVGLIDADISLHMPDFRAQERTFQLLTQVAGRAGRGDRAGEVLIQTFTPQSATIQFARRGDAEGFLENEIAQRKLFSYPPFRHLIHHLFQGRNPEKVEFFAERFIRLVEKEMGQRLEIRGPAPAALEKMNDFYRFQAWYFCSSVSAVIADLNELRWSFEWPDDVREILDVDPVGAG